MNLRIGEGWDVHVLVPGRKLIIGGVEIPHERGLLGHSDADVLLHAITDALLGAAGLGDIGRHFPDTDERFRGADSVVLLVEAARRVREQGLQIGNVDSTVVAQAPRLAPHIEAMRQRIAQALDLPTTHVNEGQDGRATGPRRHGPGHRGAGRGAAARGLTCRRRPSRGKPPPSPRRRPGPGRPATGPRNGPATRLPAATSVRLRGRRGAREASPWGAAA